MADITLESTARDQAAAVRRKEISARELLDLHLARIAERNPELNAIVSLDEERAREGAGAADERQPGKIFIAARRVGHDVAITVADTGPGIAAADRPSTKTWSNSRPLAACIVITDTAGVEGCSTASSSRSPDSATAAR